MWTWRERDSQQIYEKCMINDDQRDRGKSQIFRGSALLKAYSIMIQE